MKRSLLARMLRPASRTGMVARVILAAIAVIGSITLALTLINAKQSRAHAAGITSVSTTKQPWGLAVDGSNHIWVAEPNCDVSPSCSTPPTGAIGEYDLTTMNKINDFPAASGYTPTFLALDSNGNIWFTDPSNMAIGELVPSTGTWTEYALGYQGQPYDLVFDANGTLWFTDYLNGEIGSFSTSTTSVIQHAAVPSQAATPGTFLYGIAKAPDGTIWFAENNTHFIGSFTPAADGAIATADMTEHTVLTTQQHLLTVDKNGNVWFSTGFNGQIGELPAGASTALTFCVSNAVKSPHISGITVDSLGNVWFDDSVNARVGYLNTAQYTNDCTSGSSAGITYMNLSSGSHPHDGLIADSKDNIWFTQQYASQLTQIPAGTTLPSSGPAYPPGPVAKTWYFAEGRVGAGFSEYFTLSNPDPVNDCPITIQYLPETGTAAPKTMTVPHASRQTESVNIDLNMPANSATGLSVATIITTTGNSPCAGIVAERPMYFHYHGDASNTDVMGATHLASTFYFADVPSGNGYSSYITILNPPGGQSATVTVNYFAAGAQVGTQTLDVAAGTRGTIAPAGATPALPTHVAAVISSTQPIVVERPTYFINVPGGIVGNVTGAASVIGSQGLQNHWYFAEGYAGSNTSGGTTQENLVIANLDPANATANVTIKLEYPDGTSHPFTITVPPNSQIIWDVNAKGLPAPAKEVSADVSATGALIVVSRQMYFHYVHTLNGQKLQVNGGTEVTGQTGTASAYSFAEGYSNSGYNEWLTIQNPTANSETIYVVMMNGYGRYYVSSIPLPANSRYTMDVSSIVLTNLVQQGDDHRGYEVSMTIETLGNGGLFVAERPMYINTYGTSTSIPTQGGNDVFGYSGG